MRWFLTEALQPLGMGLLQFRDDVWMLIGEILLLGEVAFEIGEEAWCRRVAGSFRVAGVVDIADEFPVAVADRPLRLVAKADLPIGNRQCVNESLRKK